MSKLFFKLISQKHAYFGQLGNVEGINFILLAPFLQSLHPAETDVSNRTKNYTIHEDEYLHSVETVDGFSFRFKILARRTQDRKRINKGFKAQTLPTQFFGLVGISQY